MITTGIDKRVKVHQIIENQLPEFLVSESPKAVDFLKQYYISQEYQGGPIDLTDNLDQYIKLDNLTDNYFFALEKYRIETVNEIFSLYLKNGISGKRIIHNISKRRTMNNYFHKINTKYLWNNRMNINI